MSGHLLVIANGSARVLPLPGSGELTIGRSGDCQVSIPSDSVSRRHARLVLGATPTLEDLGSRNGTWINNVRVESARPLAVRPGDVLRVGEALLHFQHGPHDAAPFPVGETRASPNAGDAIVVEAPAMCRLYETVDKVARGTINVLLVGETGAGKEVVANTIHARSPRALKPFVSLSCVSFPESLLEAELFGYEKGAFTGAHASKPGLLENAEDGTVFLDEIGEISASTQSKLLRVIEDRKVQRLGSVQPRTVNVRLIAATNKDLELEVAAGRFRKDLYFRLNGITLRVPPLRERSTEIFPLARHFLQIFCTQLGSRVPEPTREALELLGRHDWPGNIRELRNVIERAVLLCGGGPIEPEHLLLGTTPAPQEAPRREDDEPTEELDPGGLRGEIQSLEREKILAALESCNGNQTRAAKRLGISRSTLVLKLDLYGVPRPRKSPRG